MALVYKTYKHSKPQKWLDFYPAIIENIELGEEFVWPEESSRAELSRTLSDFMPQSDVDHIFGGTNGWDRMDRLRQRIKIELLNAPQERATALCTWIVRNWGGIYTGNDNIPKWVEEWQGFHRGKVHDFINKEKYERIASWSKILSFAFPERYAVYDARNAAALDCIFAKIRLGRRFPITGTQNTHVNRVHKYLDKKRYAPVDLTYHDYLVLLHGYATLRFGGNLMRAEMTLFANSINIIRRYLDEQPDVA